MKIVRTEKSAAFKSFVQAMNTDERVMVVNEETKTIFADFAKFNGCEQAYIAIDGQFKDAVVYNSNDVANFVKGFIMETMNANVVIGVGTQVVFDSNGIKR